MAGPVYSWHTSATPEDEIRTIFVTGFPPDTKERELQNLLRWWPGYEACQLTVKNDAPLGFALFSTTAMAAAARDALQNLVFDLEANSTLRAEMAKKNLFVKKGMVPTPPSLGMAAAGLPASYEPNKRLRTVAPLDMGSPGYFQAPQSMPSYMAPAAPVAAPYDTAYAAYPSYTLPVTPPPPKAMHLHGSGPARTPISATPRSTRDNPPCNTLFVGNLGENVSDSELHGIFGVLPGYRQMKLLRQPHGNVCFIEYVDVESATSAHTCTQGVVLNSSDRGGLRVQFSKNPFGRKRDGTYHPSSAVGEALAAEGQNGAPGEPEIVLAPAVVAEDPEV